MRTIPNHELATCNNGLEFRFFFYRIAFTQSQPTGSIRNYAVPVALQDLLDPIARTSVC